MDKRKKEVSKKEKRGAPVNNGTGKRARVTETSHRAKPADDRAGKNVAREKDNGTVGKKTFRRGVFSKLYTAAAIVVVTAALVWAFTAFFTVDQINVYGSAKYSAEEIIGLSGIEHGDSLILFSKSRVKDRIIGDGVYIEDVSVKRLLPDTVEITVTDKTASAAFEANGAYWLVSRSGTLLELSLNCPEGATVVRGAKLVNSKQGNFFSCEDSAKQTILESVFDAMGENGLNEHIGLIDISQIYCVVLTYDDEFDIILGSAENISDDCGRIAAVVAQARSEGKTTGCFDMRDGSIRYTPDRWEANILS